MKTKNTAITRQAKAATWFQCMPSPLKRKVMITVNTISDTTSCITLSCTRLNGPPFIAEPNLFAGTSAHYP